MRILPRRCGAVHATKKKRLGRRLPILLAVVIGCCLVIAEAAAQEAAQGVPAAFKLGGIEPEQRLGLQRELERHAQLLEAQSAVVKIAAKLVGPAVVHIEAETAPETGTQYGRGRRTEEAGSGAIIQWQNRHYVLTNRHVIRNAAAADIKINLADGRLLHPTKVLVDPTTDVAVLQIDATHLDSVPLGNSDQTEIGDFVLAVGSPFGLSRSVTFGIISAKGRRTLHLGTAEADAVEIKDFLQTDAAINPGNSGGPLVNLRGQLIGINTAIASNSGGNEGIGFAIPINMFMAVARQLIETGKVTRAFLGVRLDPRFGPAMASELGLPRLVGAYVTSITPNSPAETAKLQVGDVILEFNQVPIEDDVHLVNLVSLTEVGRLVPVVIFRNRKLIRLTAEVSDRARFGPY